MDPGLRTFCHISEYDEAGYRQLHRLIAASDPLVLWAPSSQFLSDPDICGIKPKDFLHFIEEGKVRVVAREKWLNSRSFRDNHLWPAARWDPFIDDALKEIARVDEQHVSDPLARRVVIAPRERGDERAEDAIAEKSTVVDRIVEALCDEERQFEIPPGTLATAARGGDDVLSKAEVVLRDAHNHADAMRLANARTAILLSPGDGVFSWLVGEIFTKEGAAHENQEDRFNADGSTITASHLSRQLVDLLGTLEAGKSAPDFRSFMAGPGHKELIDWSRGVIELLGHVSAASLKEEMITKLQADLRAGTFPSAPLRHALTDAASLALAVLSFLEDSQPLTLFGLAFASIPLLDAAARELDLADAEFKNGPQWPFRYVYGGGPRRGRRSELVNLLDG